MILKKYFSYIERTGFGMRINKLFSNLGICSRKETNWLIEEKRVKVNGEFCIKGQWVEPDEDEIFIDDKPIKPKEKVYIALNKPVGIICTVSNEVKNNIIDFMNYSDYIFPVGRLDKESQGLIIMTNDGDLANKILESENNHEKEYIVTLNKNFDEKFIERMEQGVEISVRESTGVKRISDIAGARIIKNDKEFIRQEVRLDELKQEKTKNSIITRQCIVKGINENTFKIILTQGLDRQIRKMCASLGYKVIKLERIRIMNIKLDGIETGKWRKLTHEEITELKK